MNLNVHTVKNLIGVPMRKRKRKYIAQLGTDRKIQSLSGIQYFRVFFEFQHWRFGIGNRKLLAWPDGKQIRVLCPATLRTRLFKPVIWWGLSPHKLELDHPEMHTRLQRLIEEYDQKDRSFKHSVLQMALAALMDT